MTGWLATEALRNLGFNDEEIAQLAAAKDDMRHVVATTKALNARWARLGAALEMILEVLNREE